MPRLHPLGSALLLSTAMLAACNPAPLGRGRDRGDRALLVNTRLDCPDRQGELRRTGLAEDGRSCRYSGPDGQEVTLSYLALDGRSPEAALAPIEAELRTLVPSAAAPEPGTIARETEPPTDAELPQPPEPPEAPAAAEGVPTPPKPPEPPQVDRAWTAGGGRHGDRVKVDLPFLHIEADGTNDRAKVRVFGTEIDAGDDRAVVRGSWNGSKHEIHAGDGGAEMRFGSVGRNRADLTYILASDAPGPGGYRAAAYVAKGPVAGPLVIASGRAREGWDNHHDQADDLKDLVNRNVKVDRNRR